MKLSERSGRVCVCEVARLACMRLSFVLLRIEMAEGGESGSSPRSESLLSPREYVTARTGGGSTFRSEVEFVTPREFVSHRSEGAASASSHEGHDAFVSAREFHEGDDGAGEEDVGLALPFDTPGLRRVEEQTRRRSALHDATEEDDDGRMPGRGPEAEELADAPRWGAGEPAAADVRWTDDEIEEHNVRGYGTYGEGPAEDAPLGSANVLNIFSLARHGRARDVADLFDRGVPVDVRGQHGETVLIVACQNNNKRIAKLSLRRGADINAQNDKGNTPLHFCMAFGFHELAEYLLSKGADPELRNHLGLLPHEGLR